MRLQYCPISKGVLLLSKNTNIEWRAISSLMLPSNMCVATILPIRDYSHSFPIIAQPGYVPTNLGHTSLPPERLYQYLKTAGQQALKVMPSVKYDLNAVRMEIKNIFATPRGLMLVEGSLNLTGDLVVKPTRVINSMTLSMNDKSGRVVLSGAAQIKDNFISSLKISSFIFEGKPSLTIGSSLSDKVAMTSTTIQLAAEGNSAKIIATFTPCYYELETLFNLTIEMQIGYEFSGQYTLYPSPGKFTNPLSTVHGISGAKIIAGSFLIGTIILCVFVPEASPLLLLVAEQ